MSTFSTSREIPATVESVFAAFADSERFARWWGPAGFSNTFKICEFREGGHWVYTMHGPDGRDFANESRFDVIEPGRIVIDHISEPKYRMTILLTPSKTGTLVAWNQVFENPGMEKIRHILVPANEQNLDRLTAEVLREAA